MIAVLSPAKSLDFEEKVISAHTPPRLLEQTNQLIDTLRKKDETDIQKLMSLSEKLASLNVERYRTYSRNHSKKNAKQSFFAFRGDVYQGLEAHTFSESEIQYAQKHIRMLSGLYGLLRPLDLIQPYRLEMGTKLRINGHKNLYEFWGDTIVSLLHQDLKQQGDNILVNLASNEYFKSIDRDSLRAEVIKVSFKDLKNGTYKVISFYAKKARGMMARYIAKNGIKKVEDLKGFDYEGYYFDNKSSDAKNLTFLRG